MYILEKKKLFLDGMERVREREGEGGGGGEGERAVDLSLFGLCTFGDA